MAQRIQTSVPCDGCGEGITLSTEQLDPGEPLTGKPILGTYHPGCRGTSMAQENLRRAYEQYQAGTWPSKEAR
jgi:hypothetical protein